MEEPPSLFLLTNLDYHEVTGLLIVLVLLICSALISGSEVALFALKPTDFPSDKETFTKKQKILIRLLDRPKRLLATILITNTFINIAIVLLFDSISDQLFQNIDLIVWGISLQFIIKVVLVTFLLLLFGEILPKIYANRNSVQFAAFMALPLQVLDKVLAGFNSPMASFTRLIHRKLGNAKEGLSVDRLSQALDLTSEKETTEEEQEILQSIVSFGETDTKQVMRPRMDIFALNITQTYQEIMPIIIEQGVSRIPVYEESLDHVKGILYVKDLLPHIDKSEFEWQSLLREAYFVPENKKLDDLLNEFKDLKNHLAIVVDEYGGTSGLITMEDIIEEIVGEISDEFDTDDLVFSKLDENTYVFDGKTSLIDFYKITKIEDAALFEENKGDSETVAGFLLEIAGEFPKQGAQIFFDSYKFTVEFIDEKRIKQIKFSKG